MHMPEKFTVEQKEQIVIESFTATNIAELCRSYGVAPVNFRRWREKFIEGEKKALAQGSNGNQYEEEIDKLKMIVGYRQGGKYCPII